MTFGGDATRRHGTDFNTRLESCQGTNGAVWLQETLTLDTTESIVLDGANGVTRAPRAQFPLGGELLVLALVAGVALRFSRVGHRRTLLGLSMALAAIPGWIHVLGKRADAPVRRFATAGRVEHTLSDLKQRLDWPRRSWKMVHEEDDVLFPLGRYALPSRPASSGLSRNVELWHGPLGEACREEAFTVVCGVRP